ncbi:hypothetical protein IHE44_0011550 [Lamprotornis superbus]|uniref:Fibronectin type-III domain-containing protein n=1 Tax=Lamprotornis superbus TaxID=245042 RepID=A0A835NFG1_9PASS|nr:hypothetical protein IHE44_0011550 [Lamprotornis superbus]
MNEKNGKGQCLKATLYLSSAILPSGIRPDMPENISCIYFYDANLTCTWNAGRETGFTTKYTLYRNQMHSSYSITPCQNATESCSFFPPSNAYSNDFCFQEFVNVSLNSKKAIGSCNLTGLWDSTDYSVAIRCINNESAFWSGWSGEKNGSTEEKAPSGKVDLWRVIESSHSSRNRSVHLMWKPLKSFPPSGRILGYKIQYFPEKKTAAHKRTNNSTEKKITLLLNEEAHIISVIETVMTSTTNEEVVVEWITSEPETTKYVVEWYEELEMDPFGRLWQYVSNSTKWKNNKKNFKPFVCYNISVYPLYGRNIAAPSYAQIYVQEKKPSEGPVADTSILGKNEVTIKWNEISKAKRNGFITNYTIFYKPEDGKELNETVNSDVLQYRLKSLQADTQYTVQIMASNRAGGTIGDQKTFKTLKFDKEDFFFIAVPVGINMPVRLFQW